LAESDKQIREGDTIKSDYWYERALLTAKLIDSDDSELKKI